MAPNKGVKNDVPVKPSNKKLLKHITNAPMDFLDVCCFTDHKFHIAIESEHNN